MFEWFKKKKERPSAFRAVSSEDQQMPANEAVKVLYDLKEFDLNYEYRAARSVFVPKKDGIYLIIATISFNPASYDQNYRARLDIRINQNPYEVADNDFWGEGVPDENVVQVSAILKLEADDEVEIYAESSFPGTIKKNVPGDNATSFSAARLVEL
ncbi:ABC transporter permease [Jeotgalibacillus proteolyticus]|uniref:ABC transporter permease n=1 Tax=Jeotgalibacillus proteolyticus TaxID=2082395 RepID=A0A2S5GBQ0_9BACL|nr:ABC transporter permease [Jeotgalibacillus proteolyticus]PPA70341.1 ABC transporter permease [Jeotgalibacillus proteolyticus]